MPTLLSVRSLCERALRKIGAFSIRDTEADPEEMAETMFYLDLLVAHVTGTRRVFWLVPATLELPLLADTAEYDIADITDYPTDGVAFPINAWLRDSSGHDEPVELVRRRAYENIPDKDGGGAPQVVHIDRLTSKKVYVHPVPTDASYTLRIEAQVYSASYDVTENPNAEMRHGFGPEWQLWLIYALAAEIADGPVRRLPAPEVDRMRNTAARMLVELGDSNRETVSMPRRTAAWGA